MCHTAISALTESKLIQATNADLIEAQKRIKLRGKRLGEKAGDARVLSKKTLQKIQEIKARKAEKTAIKKRLVSQEKR